MDSVGLGAKLILGVIQFTVAGIIYYVTSLIWPPTESYVDELITGEAEHVTREHDEDGSLDEKHSKEPAITQETQEVK